MISAYDADTGKRLWRFNTVARQGEAIRIDDAYIAWINGQEISRANAPDNATWDSAATAPHSSSMARATPSARLWK